MPVKSSHVILRIGLMLTLCTSMVTPGANDLHFYDGASTADIIAGDVFFEILDPPELRYSFRVRPAKDFGAPFPHNITIWCTRLRLHAPAPRAAALINSQLAAAPQCDLFATKIVRLMTEWKRVLERDQDRHLLDNQSLHLEKARLVPTIPIHSCSDILNTEDIVGHIALSERGECSFVFKTVKAQQAGARAIIITESIDKWDESLDHLIEMVDDRMETEVNIPAAFLLGRSGATIIRTLRRLKRKHAIVNLPVNMTHVPINKMNQPPWIAW